MFKICIDTKTIVLSITWLAVIRNSFQSIFVIHRFQVMPVIIFFSASIGILYYLGVIQLIIEKIAFIMEISLGTGAMESLHAAINIFVGWVNNNNDNNNMSFLYNTLYIPYIYHTFYNSVLQIHMLKLILITNTHVKTNTDNKYTC